MVLQQDMAFGGIAEIRPVLVLAVGHEGVPHLVVALVLEEFFTVEPMFDMVAADDDRRCTEVIDIELLVLAGRNQVVQGAEGPVALHAEFRVGMPGVVQDLELAADRGRY